MKFFGCVIDIIQQPVQFPELFLAIAPREGVPGPVRVVLTSFEEVSEGGIQFFVLHGSSEDLVQSR